MQFASLFYFLLRKQSSCGQPKQRRQKAQQIKGIPTMLAISYTCVAFISLRQETQKENTRALELKNEREYLKAFIFHPVPAFACIRVQVAPLTRDEPGHESRRLGG